MAEEQDPDSILNYYRRLVRLRKEYAVIQDGDIEFLYQDQPEILGYRWCLEGQEFLVINNLTGEEILLPEPVLCEGYERLIGNYPQETS